VRRQLNTVAQTKLVRPSPSCENADIAEVAIQRTPCHIHFVQSMNSLHSPSSIAWDLSGDEPAHWYEPASSRKEDPP
jgi:hypothetical protein